MSSVQLKKELDLVRQKLRDSEEKFNAVASAIIEAFVMMNDKGEITFWNKAAEQMFGYKQEEVLGKALHTLIPVTLDHEKYKQDMHQFSQTGKTWVVDGTFELPVKKKNNIIFYIELSVSSFKLNGLWYAVGIMRDVTKRRKQAEELLEKSESFEKLNKIMVGRELKMIELKQQLIDIQAKLDKIK
jgi:PAS domain S-box-containing protein